MRIRVSAFVVVLLALAAPAAADGQAPARPAAKPAVSLTAKSLYERLGGAYPIAVVVDDFIDRLLVNATLNANPAIKEARERVPRQGLKFHVTTLVCEVTGGPCRYVGRTMKEAHARLNITEKEWQAMLIDFRKTLEKFSVPAAEQSELVTIVNSTKPDIVIRTKSSK